MKDKENNKGFRGFYRTIIILSALLIAIIIGSVYLFDNSKEELVEINDTAIDPNKIENGIHVRTGFIEAPGMLETVNNCTSCI